MDQIESESEDDKPATIIAAPGAVGFTTHEGAFALVVRVAVPLALLAEAHEALAAAAVVTVARFSASIIGAADMRGVTILVHRAGF